MPPEGTNRLPLTAGVAFAVLSVAALLVAPPGPGVDRPGSAVVDHLTSHASAIRWQALLTALSLLAMVVVVGFARQRLDGPAGHIFIIGAAVFVGQVGIEVWFTAGLTLHPGGLEPATARAVMDVAAMWGPLLTIADLMLAGPIVWGARQGRFPQWLAVIAAVFAVEQFVELVTIIGPVGSFIAPGGPMNLILGGALFVVFVVALGVAVAMPEPTTLPPARSPA
ncbi:hypothetical protein [Mycobacterium sp. DL592]|uniref:hypothetical protein n=1 Tax=Mycobacterium sp. DL592 TaxID=2675524 RepID=UPI001FBB5BE3|nr:hypothetical protein [Mycobacterium sp. DL592]